MGQKINPTGFRVGIIRGWSSRWFAKKDYAKLLHEDIYIRRYVKKKLYHGGVSHVDIERTADSVRVKIHAARPGIIIGKRGAEVDTLRIALQKITQKQINIDVLEVKDPELDAQLIAENIASQLERRVAFRRAMKKSILTAMQLGAKGVKIRCGGRLAGAEIARHEWYKEGRLPLHTLRADIDYGRAEASTTYGLIGIKAWVFKGEILGPERQMSEALKAQIERKVKGTPKRSRPAFKPRSGAANRWQRPATPTKFNEIKRVTEVVGLQNPAFKSDSITSSAQQPSVSPASGMAPEKKEPNVTT